MLSRLNNIFIFLTGDLISAVVSYQLLKEIGSATAIAIATGFFGGMAAILGKMLINKIFKNKDNGKTKG